MADGRWQDGDGRMAEAEGGQSGGGSGRQAACSRRVFLAGAGCAWRAVKMG